MCISPENTGLRDSCRYFQSAIRAVAVCIHTGVLAFHHGKVIPPGSRPAGSVFGVGAGNPTAPGKLRSDAVVAAVGIALGKELGQLHPVIEVAHSGIYMSAGEFKRTAVNRDGIGCVLAATGCHLAAVSHREPKGTVAPCVDDRQLAAASGAAHIQRITAEAPAVEIQREARGIGICIKPVGQHGVPRPELHRAAGVFRLAGFLQCLDNGSEMRYRIAQSEICRNPAAAVTADVGVRVGIVSVIRRYGDFCPIAELIGDSDGHIPVCRRDDKPVILVKGNRLAAHRNGVDVLLNYGGGHFLAINLTRFNALDDRGGGVNDKAVGA